MEKVYTINGEKVTIKGTEALHDVIGKFESRIQELQTSIDTAPKLGEQLEFWKKAEPILTKHGKKIDYNSDRTAVMNEVLTLSGYDTKEITPDTASYLFKNVLKLEETTPTLPDISGNPPSTTPAKPSVNPPATTTLTSEDMGNAWLTSRMTGEVVSNGVSSSVGATN
jgi:hypothetical protein